MRTRWMIPVTCLLLLILPASTPAAPPPDLVNYQGVLRDSAGAPLDGAFAMEFHFYDAQVGGSQLLLNTPAVVTVTGGLFDVALGSGGVADGSGPGTYLSLAELFSDFDEVWMEIFVVGEMLAPRVRIVAAPYALNAGRLGGKPPSEFLDTSASSQTKAGDLGVGDLTVGGLITISGGSPGAGKVLTSDATGQAGWMDQPVAPEQVLLQDLADRLQTGDPQELPFAGLGSFDCAGASTATMSFAIDGVLTGDVAGFVGRDRISETFEYLVSIESLSPIVESAQIGKVGRLTITRTAGTTTFSGRITEFGLAAMDGATRTYVARLEPRVSELRRSSGYGVYQANTLPDIIDNELSSAGIANYSLSITGSPPVKEMVLQYNETTLDFLGRLSEQDGLHYHFEEIAAEERLIWGDHNGAFPLIAGAVTYDGDMVNPGGGQEFISTFHARDRQHTATGTVKGYDLTNPATLIEQTSAAGSGIGERYEFFAAGVNNAIAAERAQALVDRDQVRRLEHSGTSNAAALKAGHKFVLTDHTSAGFGGTYIVTEVTHFALADPDPTCVGYGNVFASIPDTTTYRPPRVTPKPVVKGPMTAVVTGPAGEEIYTDSYGRIKVKFHWDRVSPADETSSSWIRVAAPAGRTDDLRWVPKVGTEVVVDFLQGDPDRPIVVGSVYNGIDLPPATDTLSLEGDLTVSGNDIFFGAGGRLLGSTATTLQVLGNANTDDILLYAGDTIDDGALRVLGDSTFEMRSGSGLFTFVNGGAGAEVGRIDAGGNAQFDGDLTVSGSDLLFGFGNSARGTASGLTITAGESNTDDLILRAGNTFDDGEISILGDSTIGLRSGNGLYQMIAGDTGFLMDLNQTSASLNEWKFGGTNLNLFLGDSGADQVFVPGTLSVTGTKNFVQNHPHRGDLSVVYTALEGDEAGTYTRGSARLVGGEARVRLGETFAWVTNPDVGLTAHVTPRSAWADLYVASISSTELVVRARSGSDAEAAFDYIVHGLRIGYEDYSVLQPRRMDGNLPSRASVESYYETSAALRPYNALERFRRMDAQTRRAAPGSPAAPALREAIGERPSDVPGERPGADDISKVGIARSTPVITGNEQGAAGTAGDPGRSTGKPRDEEGIATVGALPLDEQGHAYARSFRTVDSELAAFVPVTEDVELGDLVVVDRDDPSQMRPATRQGDPAVVGVVSGQPGVLLGGADDPDTDPDEVASRPQAPVAFSGITTVKVDAGFGAITVGDLLTSSPTIGHAMRADDPAPGTIVGKALEPLDTGTGRVRVLVMLR